MTGSSQGSGAIAGVVLLIVVLAFAVFVRSQMWKDAQAARKAADETCLMMVYGVKCDDEDGKAVWRERNGLR